MMSESLTHPEVKSQAELNSTEVSPRTARAMAWAFVAILFTVPVVQLLLELSQQRTPQALSLFAPAMAAIDAAAAGDLQAARDHLRTLFTRDHLRNFETSLVENSDSRRAVQPRLQEWLARWLDTGNDTSVILARNGWMFYRPGLTYLAGPNVIDARALRHVAKKMVDDGTSSDPNPDARPALIQFHRDCEQAGIQVVFVPIPDKAMLQPGELTRRLDHRQSAPVPNNRGYGQFVDDIRRAGLEWYDPTPSQIDPEDPRYLKQDTHWTPAFMSEIAVNLSRHLLERVPLPPAQPKPALELRVRQVALMGDLVKLLALDPGQHLFQTEKVAVSQVVDRSTNQPWRPSRDADVLLLGDSFTAIYSTSREWGGAAGLPAHLAYHLGRPLDSITVDGGGPSLLRERIAGPEGRQRLAGKKLIVYEFAIRELYGRDWKKVPFETPAGGAAASP